MCRSPADSRQNADVARPTAGSNRPTTRVVGFMPASDRPHRKSHLYSRLRQVICAGRGTRENIGPKNQKMLDSGPPLNEDKRISAMLWSQVPCSGVKGRY